MRAFGETLFDVIYLVTVITLGILMIIKSKKMSDCKNQCLLFGIMAVVLGFGDAFHLIPRAYALCTSSLDNYVAALGIGKLITSITMTIFYVILFYVWKIRYKVSGIWISVLVWVFAIVRIILCIMPQNMWTSADAPLNWGIYRNIPFAMLGLLIIILFLTETIKHKDKDFGYLWLTIVLSFGFYIPVVLFADKYPMIGMLMIPKTCAYVWTIVIGYKAYHL